MVDLGRASILVADDEPSTRAMVARHLRSIGYKVVEAVDGDEALALALEHLPDLVVLDVMMPGMSGWEVCRRIRETVSLAHTGVVMLTGIGESINEITSPLYGADAHLDKPFEFAVLDRTIAETIESRRDHVGRPDGADVEIVQTTDEADESSQPPPAKLKRARLTDESNTDEEDSFLKSLGKRAARRKAAEASSDMNDGSSENRVEFNFLDGPTKPAKKRAGKAYLSTEPAPVVTKSRRRSKAATDGEQSDEGSNGDLLELSPVSTKKRKLAKAKKSKPSSSKKKPAKKAASKKPVAPRSAKVSKVAKKAGKKKAGKKAAKGKKRTSSPKKSAKRRVIAKKAVGKASAKARANSVKAKAKAAPAQKKSKARAKAAKKTSRVKPAAKKQLVKKAPAKAAKKAPKSKGKKKARR